MKNWLCKSANLIHAKVNSLERCDRLVIYDSLIQLVLILINAVVQVEAINRVLFVNLYLVIGLMMISIVIKGIAEHFLIFSFTGCFFIFLMGQKPFMDEYNVFLTFTRTELDCKQYLVFTTIMSLGLIVMYVTYLFTNGKRQKLYGARLEKVCNRKSCGMLIRIFFYLTLPLALYMQLKIVIVRSGMSYTDGYLMNVEIPAIVKIGYYLFINFMLMYLAIKPRKREMYPVLLIFLILEGGVQLIQGRRALFATTLLFIVWYLMKYYNVTWIAYKYLILVGTGALGMMVLFFFVEQMRGDQAVSSFNLFEMLQSFLISTGGSDSVIANTIVRKNLFPGAKLLYILNPIIFNPVTMILTGKTGIVQGPEHLETFHNFSHWISYLTEPSLYESGHGMGTAYLAEAYFVGGILGVIVISVVLGYVLKKMSGIHFQDNFVVLAITFIFVQNLFTMPRGAIFEWFDRFTYFMVSLVMLYVMVKLFRRDKVSEKE